MVIMLSSWWNPGQSGEVRSCFRHVSRSSPGASAQFPHHVSLGRCLGVQDEVVEFARTVVVIQLSPLGNCTRVEQELSIVGRHFCAAFPNTIALVPQNATCAVR